MIDKQTRLQLFPLTFEPDIYRRIIADTEVVLHCHHYNARLQSIIEGAASIDGRGIFLGAAEETFARYAGKIFAPHDSDDDKWAKAVALYRHLGFGILDISRLGDGVVSAPMSHFVEGWMAGFPDDNEHVCTFTEGFLQGVVHAISGGVVSVKETACMNAGAQTCEFVIDGDRATPFPAHTETHRPYHPKPSQSFLRSDSVDEGKIIRALVDMPFYGNEDGLMPAFNVYLANMPADFYTLLSLSFLEEMRKVGMLSSARKLLIYAGEVCALNTLRGIRSSAEWDELIRPMVDQPVDDLHGLIAVTNGLGWGNWHICSHEPGESLQMESINGYEALGHVKYQGFSDEGQCCMLTGVAAGIMAMLYREGTVEERVGTFYSEEAACICSRDDSCVFRVEAL